MARRSDPNRRENIIIAAITLFSQKGYAGSRIAEVANAAGIGKGTIYEYFRSKEDLFFATFEHLMSDTGRQINTMAQSTDGAASKRLTAMADAVMTEWLSHLDIYGLILEFWSATAASPGRQRFKAAFHSTYSEYRKVVANLVQDGITGAEFKPEIDPEKIAAALIGSWDALLFQAWLDPDFDPLSASRSHVAVVVAGLQHHKAAAEELK